ncbi:TPA: MarR family transcriptional regulator [Pseudomonas aeruginosa]|nr:MarR family transcriptional regulator [Pseudomonas aeruginosa]
MESQSSELEHAARHDPLKLLGIAYRTFSRLVDAQLREHGFAMGQLPVLVALKHGDALSQGELARRARVEQPSMAQLLNRMERDGLVQRTPDPADGRSRLISLTPLARKRLPKARAVMEAMGEQALAGFDAQDLSQFATLMLRINRNLDALE